jgi:hypothetical protein
MQQQEEVSPEALDVQIEELEGEIQMYKESLKKYISNRMILRNLFNM